MNTTRSNISFTVDGTGVAPSLIRIPNMSLSSARATLIEHRFRLEIPLALLCTASEKAWENYVAKRKKDDERHGGPDEEDWVAKAGYPLLEKVLCDPEELDLLFGPGGSLVHYVMPTILGYTDALSNQNNVQGLYYLDHMTVEKVGDVILWAGLCYSKDIGKS